MRPIAKNCETCDERFQTKKLWSEHTKAKKCARKTDVKAEEDECETSDNEVIMLDEESDDITGPTQTMEETNMSETSAEAVNDPKEDDGIEVVKSTIYKYQGSQNNQQDIKDDVFRFKYFDDFEDNEDVVLLEDENDEESNESMDSEDEVESPDPVESLQKCGECDHYFEEEDLAGHVIVNHPVQKKEMKHFAGGNFFMLAA